MTKNTSYEICYRFLTDNYYLFNKEIIEIFKILPIEDLMNSEDFFCFMLFSREEILKDAKELCERLNKSSDLCVEYLSNKKRLNTLNIDRKLGKLVIDESSLNNLFTIVLVCSMYSNGQNKHEAINKKLDTLINKVLYMSDYNIAIESDCIEISKRLIDNNTLLIIREYDKNIGFFDAESLISELNAPKN